MPQSYREKQRILFSVGSASWKPLSFIMTWIFIKPWGTNVSSRGFRRFFVQTHTVPRNITVIRNITDLLQHLTFPRETSETAGLDRSCEMLWTHFWSPGDLWSTNWPSPPVFWPGPIACVTRSCCEPYLPHITICMLDGQGCISTVTLFPFYPTSPGAQSMDEQLPAPSVLTKQGGFCTRYVWPSTASMENKYIHTHQAQCRYVSEEVAQISQFLGWNVFIYLLALAS